MGAGMGAGVAGSVVAAEVCAPLLLLCWLCCWPDDDKSESSRGKPPKKPVVANGSSFRRRSTEFFSRHFCSSAASLHLPSTSGHSKQPLTAHRSHEEIPHSERFRRRKSHLEIVDDARYHSAPSVIHEVLHRRDWEKSTKDLTTHIPLKPSNEDITPTKQSSENIDKNSPRRNCKKHHMNIKTSTNKVDKESTRYDVKDEDATERSNFYLGDVDDSLVNNDKICEAKEAKQSINECIRSKDLCGEVARVLELGVDEVELAERSVSCIGGERPSLVPSVSRLAQLSALSIEPVSYAGGACYLAEVGSVPALQLVRGRAAQLRADGDGADTRRHRHASDGDILANVGRPESGAFSESDLEMELEACAEPPPDYAELQQYCASDTKETAI